MHRLKLCVLFVLATAATRLAAQDGVPLTPQQYAKALIGREYVARELEMLEPSCTEESGRSLGDSKAVKDWSYGNIACHGKPIMTVIKLLGYVGNMPRWRIVDAIAMPEYQRDGWPGKPGTLHQTMSPCTVDGKLEDTLVVLVREGRRHERVGEREDVAYGWRTDLRLEKIVPVSVKRIRCIHDEP